MTGAGASLPVVVSTVRAVATGWVPVGDRGVIAAGAYDVFTMQSPLVGVFSSSSFVAGQLVHHPGPLLYWLLAVPAHFLFVTAMPVWMGVVNAAAIIGVVALADRRGGRALMFAVAGAVALMCGSFTGETYHDIYNPSAPLLPFTLLIFLGWSVSCGEYRLLPLTVLVASFTAQSHLTFVVPSAGILAVALGGLAASRALRSQALGAKLRPEGSGFCGKRSFRRWAFFSLLVALACWSGPLGDQAVNHPGNLRALLYAAEHRGATLGAAVGWHAVVRAIGVPPWWLRPPQASFARYGDIVNAPSAAETASCVLVLAFLVILAWLGWRRRRRDVAAAAGLGLMLCAVLAGVVASTPTDGFARFSVAVASSWASAVGVWVWLTVGWSVATLLCPKLRFTFARAALFLSAAALGVVIATGAVVAAGEGQDQERGVYRPVQTILARLSPQLPRSGAIRVDAPAYQTSPAVDDVLAGVVYGLRRRGNAVLTALSFELGDAYAIANRPYKRFVEIETSNRARSSGRTIVQVSVPSGTTTDTFTVALLPGSAGEPTLVCPPVAAASTSRRKVNDLGIVPGAVAGSIDHSQIVRHTVEFCGWAANVKDHHAADSILVLSNGRFVRAVRPTISRPDVRSALGVSNNSGFSLQVPVSAIQPKNTNTKVQLVGVEGGVATPLPFDCKHKPHDFGC